MGSPRPKFPARWPPFLPSLVAILFALAGCGSDGGNGDDDLTPVSTLAYVVNECRETEDGDSYIHQELRIRQGERAELTIAEVKTSGPPLFPGLCRLWADSRWGAASVYVGAFQRLGVSPDGSTVVFEVTDDFSISYQDRITQPAEEGIFTVRADGTGLRRLGPASRDPCFRFAMLPEPTFGNVYHVFAFSPDGRKVTFTDVVPGPDGVEATQIFTLDIATGARFQLTNLPPDPRGLDPTLIATGWPKFANADTVAFRSHSNPPTNDQPGGANPEGKFRSFTVKTDGSQLGVVPTLPLPGAEIAEGYAITGADPVGSAIVVPGKPENPPGFFGDVVVEIFIFDGEDVLQLSNFGRSDTTRPIVLAGENRVLFVASTNRLGTNPSETCQFFSIDRTGADLRQVTHFEAENPNEYGCSGFGPPPGCTIRGTATQDLLTKTIIFFSNCDPLGTNPSGGQIFAMRPDGSGLRQLTSARGLVIEPDGTVNVELPGPTANPTRGF